MKIDLILIGNQGFSLIFPKNFLNLLVVYIGAGKTSLIKRFLFQDSEAKGMNFTFDIY